MQIGEMDDVTAAFIWLFRGTLIRMVITKTEEQRTSAATIQGSSGRPSPAK
jgi:hypothetical protein